MLINIPPHFPALRILAEEQIDVSTIIADAANTKAQLKIAVVNLMPMKIITEADVLRLLSNSPLCIHIDFVRIESHMSQRNSRYFFQIRSSFLCMQYNA